MKTIRTHLAIMYDDLWAEHIRLSTGKIVKPFKDRHAFNSHPLSEGFKKQKPEEFKEIDRYINNINLYPDMHNFYLDIVRYSDNRMMMGDYRYGSILRQNLDNYDVRSEFFRRLKVAKDTKNLEYVYDSYNMLRIQYFKTKNFQEFKDLYQHHLQYIIINSYLERWNLTSIDDGIHAIEK